PGGRGGAPPRPGTRSRGSPPGPGRSPARRHPPPGPSRASRPGSGLAVVCQPLLVLAAPFLPPPPAPLPFPPPPSPAGGGPPHPPRFLLAAPASPPSRPALVHVDDLPAALQAGRCPPSPSHPRCILSPDPIMIPVHSDSPGRWQSSHPGSWTLDPREEG